ncbi:MAG: FHA domain-containing serine/threonine-protein kinase [Candidatus Azobacteroides sp.]|nr:FHA domain-containing serine/threonine-protein kinase [Candidatus Azobacteroides sp.]
MNLPKIPYYHIDSLISSGGTANVYRGVDLRSGREVAVKALFSKFAKNDFIMGNFRKEADRYLHLSHPNIVKLVDFVEDKDQFYLIMEYVDGVPLDVYLNTTGPMSDKTVIPLFCQILDTIEYLHNHEDKILHLDIKPNNIMVLENQQIKVLDMGISAIINEKNDNPKRCGTPAFMAPEQINRGELGLYTDIFALGVTFFNLITGELPFAGIDHTTIFEKICNDPTPTAIDFYSEVNPKFQAIIGRALQKQGSKRYQTCKEFKNDLLKIYNNDTLDNIDNSNDMKTITIGRELDNTIVIDDAFVGRKHLEMVQDNSGNVTLTDLHSKNGTFVNGRKIASGETVHLASTDIVRIGNTPIPWKSYFVTANAPATNETPRIPWWKKIQWRTIFTVITSIVSLLFMLFMIYRMLKK